MEGAADRTARQPQPAFVEHLARVLNALYDPAALRASPLVELFGLSSRRDPITELQRLLIHGIEALGPAQGAPRDSRAWRIHQILRRRYVEQLTQRQVAADLGLSRRQLQREEKTAREALAAHLWAQHNLGERTAEWAAGAREGIPAPPARARALELAHLRQSVKPQATDITALVRHVLATIRPLLEASGVSVETTIPSALPPWVVRAPLLRQALLNALTSAVRRVPGGAIALEVTSDRSSACLHVCARSPHPQPLTPDPEFEESIEIARALAQLMDGSLEVGPLETSQQALEMRLRLPLQAHLTVLVIDDNQDALQLARRYLQGSRYQFVGTSDPQDGLRLAEQVAPRVVVLDVMMPDYDGWMLLGQLREHPATRGTPVIICTILAQEELASALGAAEYLRKPVSRADFLAALDRQTGAATSRCP